MKIISSIIRYPFFLFLICQYNLVISQCVDTNNIHTFTYNGTTYELVKELKTWSDAAACAITRGGVLAEINDINEQTAIFNEILNNGGITYGISVPTIPIGNGNGSFVWLGGNDLTTEGDWMWDGGNFGINNQFWNGNGTGSPINSSFENWASSPSFSQPNDRQGEDALALSVNGWSNGNSGDWRDIDETNILYYLIEVQLDPNDTIAPIPDSNTLQPVTGQCFISNPTIPTASDIFPQIINGVSDVSFPIVGVGSYTVTWTYTDFLGNFNTQTQLYTIIDTTPPSPILSSLNDITSSCLVDSIPAPTANDICSGLIIGTTNTNFPITTLGSSTIIWSFDDGNGNISLFNQTVTIQDTIAPLLDNPIQTISSNCPITSLTAPTATDNCSGVIVGTTSTLLPIVNTDTTIIEWVFNDGNGNSLIIEQIVYINPFFSEIEQNGSVLTAIESGLNYQWLDCENGYSEILNETNQSFTITSNGEYSVVVSDGTCQDTSDCITIIDLNINKSTGYNPILVYPNPIVDKLTIKSLNKHELYTIKIINIEGKTLRSQRIAGINTLFLDFNYKPGLYIISIEGNEKPMMFKMVKE